MNMWQPIETAPKDRFLLLCAPSGYTTVPLVFTTGRMCSDYHAGRWIDHANDDLSDWGFEPTHWMPLPELPGAQQAPSVPDGWLRAIDEALVTAHIGVANAHDTYEQAREKLDNLLGFHVAVATDPAVNGGWKLVPIEPTQEMVDHVIDERLDALVAGEDHTFIDIYKAMLNSSTEAKS